MLSADIILYQNQFRIADIIFLLKFQFRIHNFTD